MRGADVRVLIVGAGIAGLAAARCVRDWGAAVEIVERTPGPATEAPGYTLPGNAVRALDAIGLGASVTERAVRIERQRTTDHRGRVLFDVDVTALWHGVGPSLALHRADLHQAMLAGVGDVPIRWGHALRAVRLDRDGVTAEQSDGSPDPMSAARYRERHTTSGAKSDPGDAHVLAEIVRLDREHHRPVAGDSPEVEGLKLVARTHQSLIWDRTRHLQRLRQLLREYYPGLLDALAAAKLELGDPDAWELIERAPDPDRAARLSRSKITAILRRNRRRNAAVRAEQIQAVLRAPALRQPAAVQAAYATIAATQIRLLITLAGQIPALEEVLAQGFAGTRTLRSTPACPGSVSSSVPGCCPSSETTHTATTTRKPARTTPGPRRSPAPPAARSWCWPATPATAAWAMRSTSGPSAP